MNTCQTPSRAHSVYWEDVKIPWFTLADVWQLRQGNKYLGETSEKISRIGLENSAAELLPPGTVVLSRTASVGFSGIMPIAMATSQDYWNWVCGEKLLPEYLWFQFRVMHSEFDRIKSGSTHKTIYQADAAAIALVLPDLDRQAAIVDELRQADETFQSIKEDALAAIDLAKERRSALISAAVTGQLDVTNL
ncbi:MAG: restriction endonuclease subunit S, partial [Galactobacter sp.]